MKHASSVSSIPSSSLDTVDGSSSLQNIDDDGVDDDDDPFAGSAAAFREKLAMKGGKSGSLKALSGGGRGGALLST